MGTFIIDAFYFIFISFVDMNVDGWAVAGRFARDGGKGKRD
jgi:hypothetical protein